MNPFLESTVATPKPDAQWRPPHPPCVDVNTSRPGSPKTQAAASKSRRSRRREGLRPRRGIALRVLALASSLLLPVSALAVDINTATVQQLQEIKGIGPKTANLIIEERDRAGAFESMADVSERVKGIGPKKAASLEMAGLKVGGASTGGGKEPDPATRSTRRGR